MADGIQFPSLGDAVTQANFDKIREKWPEKYYLDGSVGTFDVPLRVDTNLVKVFFDLDASGFCELRCLPNNDVAAIYSSVRDGSVMNPAAAAIAAAGAVNHNNGWQLVYAPVGAIAGGMSAVGMAVIQTRQVTARRTMNSQATVTSQTGSANQVVEEQNNGGMYNSNAALQFLRFVLTNAATMKAIFQVEQL